jgi:PPOX class probable F420-dependent enzyme
MRDLTPDEVRTFLTERPRTGQLATVRADGWPHVAPIWFALDGDDVLFTTFHTSVKGRNLQRDGRAALGVDDAEPPYAYVIVEGTVAFDTDPARRAEWTRRIAGRYMGEDRAEEFGARNDVDGEWLTRLTPTRIIAKTGITD